MGGRGFGIVASNSMDRWLQAPCHRSPSASVANTPRRRSAWRLLLDATFHLRGCGRAAELAGRLAQRLTHSRNERCMFTCLRCVPDRRKPRR